MDTVQQFGMYEVPDMNLMVRCNEGPNKTIQVPVIIYNIDVQITKKVQVRRMQKFMYYFMLSSIKVVQTQQGLKTSPTEGVDMIVDAFLIYCLIVYQ